MRSRGEAGRSQAWAAAAGRLWGKGPLPWGSRGSQVSLCPAATACPASWSPQARDPAERERYSYSGPTFKRPGQGQVSFWAGAIGSGWAVPQPQGSFGPCWVWGRPKDQWGWGPSSTADQSCQTEGWFPSPLGPRFLLCE